MSRKTLSDQDEVAGSINVLSEELYKKLNMNHENSVCSPFGVAITLAMLYEGACGQTAKEIAKALHFEGTKESLSRGMAALLSEFHNSFTHVLPIELLKFYVREPRQSQENHFQDNTRRKDELNLATALWVQRDCLIEQPYRDTIQQFYGGAIFEVDFTDPEQAREKINEWVSQQTKGKIVQVIPRDMFTPISNLLRVGIINTIFFSGRWLYPFDRNQTRDQPFYLHDGRTIFLPFMHIKETFCWVETDTLQYVELPYRGDALVMGILLPTRQDGLPQVEQDLTISQLLHLVEAAKRRKLNLFLPRFRIDSTFHLLPVFKQLGIIHALDPEAADLTTLTHQKPRVYLGEALHKTYIDVDEEGTVAAAFAGLFIIKGYHPIPTFKADHPFLFFIRHTGTGQLLFIGHWTGIGYGGTPVTPVETASPLPDENR